MKNLFQALCFLLFPILIVGQTASMEVISSAGDGYQGDNASISWTLGELATETYSNESIIISQGFHQAYDIIIHGIDLDLLVFLEGSYDDGSMNSTLGDAGLIPNQQPYDGQPWNYNGSENVTNIPEGVVDWVLIEIRDADNADLAVAETSVERKAAFLLEDGSVVDLDGVSILEFTASITKSPFVVVWHRNHIGILSATAPVFGDGVYSYDFSLTAQQAYGGELGYKLISAGIFGMAGGDADADGNVDISDKTALDTQAGLSGYYSTDFNLDAQVNNKDKNDNWLLNNGSISSQIPE